MTINVCIIKMFIRGELNMKKVKVGIIGGGWFAHYHLMNLLKMEEVEVVAMATRRVEALDDVKDMIPHATIYSSFHTLLDEEGDLDALVVALPPHAHDSIEIIAAKRGIHLYVEKPLGVDLKIVKETHRVIKESGIICSVGYQTRYNSVLQRIKETLDTVTVGAVSGIWNGAMPPPLWWRDKNSSGGQLHEQATHIVDVFRFLFGEIVSVYSTGSTRLMSHIPLFNTEDVSMSIYTFASGLKASVQCGCFVDEMKGVSTIGFSIYADGAKIEYEWDKKAIIRRLDKEETYLFGNTFHYTAVNAFIKAIMLKDISLVLSDYEDAYQTFLATLAATISMEEKRVVLLSEL